MERSGLGPGGNQDNDCRGSYGGESGSHEVSKAKANQGKCTGTFLCLVNVAHTILPVMKRPGVANAQTLRDWKYSATTHFECAIDGEVRTESVSKDVNPLLAADADPVKSRGETAL